MRLQIFILVLFLVLRASSGFNRTVIKVGNLQENGLGVSAVYQAFQSQGSSAGFLVNTKSGIYTKIPGLTLVLQHYHPMLYELNFEAVCRFEPSGSVFRIEFLYNDHTLTENKFYKNNVSTAGSGRTWWFSPMQNAHHFVCTRSETVYLAPGIYLIEVGAQLAYYDPVGIYSGQLTAKLTQYQSTQDRVGSLPMLRT